MRNSLILTKALRDLASIAMLFALVLSSLGPALDHHIAERQPDHQHIYYGQVNPDHTHPYQQSHHHANAAPPGSEGPSGTPSGDILYLTSSDGVSQTSLAIILPGTLPDQVAPDPGDESLFVGAADGYHTLREASISIPKKPPRG
ncbi:MAG: hypothetical protein FJ316_10750 [SAR202 cluster bacterium]|nr:hypothetical protein [SAR202 cluster bacterium]